MNTGNKSDTDGKKVTEQSDHVKPDDSQVSASPNPEKRSAFQLIEFFISWKLAYLVIILLGIHHYLVQNYLIDDYFVHEGSATFPLIMLICLIFIHIYTDPVRLPPLDGSDLQEKRKFEEANQSQRRRWMVFAYGFMLVSLIITLCPFIVPYGGQIDKDKVNNTIDKGVSAAQQSDTRAQSINQPSPNEEAKEKSEKEKPENTRYKGKSVIETLRERPIVLLTGYSLEAEEKKQQQAKVAGEKQGNSTKSGTAKDIEWVVNIGGYIETCELIPSAKNGDATVCAVRGGLLVPLYFIILALMGGSISLTRRLPELQKMVSPGYVATDSQPRLSQHEFREHLIFHIVQFISAPFLAVLAYYLIEPSTTANSVALAFTAGFASESILLMIRSVVDKISPRTGSTVQYGTIIGVVTLLSPDKSERPVAKVMVSLADIPHVTTLTDEQGLYILGNVPVGVNNLLITYSDAEDKVDSVRVERAQSVVRKNMKIEAKKAN